MSLEYYIYINIILVILIFFSSLSQKYYYFILSKIIRIRSSFFWFIKIIIRWTVIIHEFCHLIFWLITFIKIIKIDLFNPNWWRVDFESRNYIWDLPLYATNWMYLFKLFFNQIWLFFISIWPLVIWVLINSILLKYFFWIETLINNYIFLNNFSENIYFIFVLILYVILILPGFILSFIDIKNFIISKQETIWATIIWSIINTFIFLIFLFFISYLYIDFFNFFILYFISLILVTLIYSIVFILNLLYKLFLTKNIN